MKKTTTPYIFRIIAITLILAMTFGGCGRHKKTETVEPMTEAKTGIASDSKTTAKTDSKTGAGTDAKDDTATNSYDIATTDEAESSKPDVMLDSFFTYGTDSVEAPAMASEGSLVIESYSKEGDGEGDWGDFVGDEPIWIDDPVVPIDPAEPWEPEPVIEPVAPRAGLLTAGEWNDNRHMDFLRNLLANGQEQNYKEYFNAWNLRPFNRIVVHVTDPDGADLRNVKAEAYSAAGALLGSARTDNRGIAYIFYNLVGNTEEIPSFVQVTVNDVAVLYEVTSADLMDDSVAEISFANIARVPKQLDLMMVVDTTGSMGDEIRYLQTELEDVISRVSGNNANLPIRLSVNFYRDLGDDYVVKSHPFSSNIDEQMAYLRVEYAEGGGDYEEAVEMALEDAVNNHDWSEDSTKIMFIVLDAPPHNTADIRASLASTLADAAAKGIRIVPIASSGVDKSTEFLLRTFAMVTGGTYTFLTNDSGIGGDHIEPTIGSYDVEYLNDLMVGIIDEYLK